MLTLTLFCDAYLSFYLFIFTIIYSTFFPFYRATHEMKFQSMCRGINMMQMCDSWCKCMTLILPHSLRIVTHDIWATSGNVINSWRKSPQNLRVTQWWWYLILVGPWRSRWDSIFIQGVCVIEELIKQTGIMRRTRWKRWSL